MHRCLVNDLCSQLRSSADPAERRRVQLLQPFVGGVQSRLQRLQRQLLARQRTAQSADTERPLQAEVRPAVAQQQEVVPRRVQYVLGTSRIVQLHSTRGWVLG